MSGGDLHDRGRAARLVPVVTLAFCAALSSADLVGADTEAGRLAYEQGDYPTAIREFRRAAAAGHPDALFQLGVMYIYGVGVPGNVYLGLPLWEQAADLGQTSAMFELGFSFRLRGFGHPELPEDIKTLADEAAAGETWAMFQLGRYYAEGWDVPRDYAQARLWWEKATGKGDYQSCYALGVLASTGRGMARDYAQARKRYEQVAAQGHTRAMYELGRLLADGRGGPRDYVKARAWWEKAAAQGLAPAMSRLGELAAEGLGVAKNDGEARRWWEQAAGLTYVPAMMHLGAWHQRRWENLASEPAAEEAYVWFARAARYGNTRAVALRDQLAATLPPKRLALAQRMAENWAPKIKFPRY